MSNPSKSTWQKEVLPEIFIIRWTRRLLRWLFSRRGARALLITLAWIVTIVALIYGEENWRGKRAWNQYRTDLEGRGESLDFKAYLPAPIPDDQNFAATPFFKFAFEHRTNKYLLDTDPFSRASTAIVGYDNGQRSREFMDLVAWSMALEAARSDQWNPDQRYQSGKFDAASRAAAVPQVLEGLKADAELFAELREASSRPHARYMIDYTLEDPWGILLPHLVRVRNICQRLQLQACAELATGNNEKAMADERLMLRLADSLENEPTIISVLVRNACVSIAAQPVWEGLAEHRWTETQLQELQSRFAKYDLVADLEFSLHAERAAVVLTADLLAARKYRISQLSGEPSVDGPGNLVGYLIPRGWFCQEQLSYCRLLETQWSGALDITNQIVRPNRVDSNYRHANHELSNRDPFRAVIFRHDVLARMMLPALSNLASRTARAQVVVGQVQIACALERYRLANGQFPENLDALVPRFISSLPHDVINGGAYKYRRTADGQFVLYSIGWNEKDDGGTVATKKEKPVWEEGDWVW